MTKLSLTVDLTVEQIKDDISQYLVRQGFDVVSTTFDKNHTNGLLSGATVKVTKVASSGSWGGDR